MARPGLNPAAGLLVPVVAVPAVVALVVLFFVRGPVPWLGSLRCSWPCCRPSPVCSCRLPPVRIAAGVVVSVGAFVGALVGLVAFKEQGGAGDPRPGRFHLAPGLLSAWSCRSRAGLLRLVPVVVGVLLLLVAVRADRRRGGCARRCGRGLPGRAGGRVIRGPGGTTWRRASIRRPGLLVVLVVVVALVAVPVLAVSFFARGPVPWSCSLRRSWPPPLRIAAGLPVVVVVGCRPCGSPPGWSCPPWSCWSPAKSRAAGWPAARVVPPGAGPAVRQVVPISARVASPDAGPDAGSPEVLPVFASLPGDPPAAAGPRSGVRAPGGPGRRGRCPGPVRCAAPGLAAGCCRRGPAAGRRPCGSLAGAWSNLIRYTVTSGLGPAAPFLPLGAWSARSWW